MDGTLSNVSRVLDAEDKEVETVDKSPRSNEKWAASVVARRWASTVAGVSTEDWTERRKERADEESGTSEHSEDVR